jgi:hypothetical protein
MSLHPSYMNMHPPYTFLSPYYLHLAASLQFLSFRPKRICTPSLQVPTFVLHTLEPPYTGHENPSYVPLHASYIILHQAYRYLNHYTAHFYIMLTGTYLTILHTSTSCLQVLASLYCTSLHHAYRYLPHCTAHIYSMLSGTCPTILHTLYVMLTSTRNMDNK